jgi:hypothetical protein
MVTRDVVVVIVVIGAGMVEGFALLALCAIRSHTRTCTHDAHILNTHTQRVRFRVECLQSVSERRLDAARRQSRLKAGVKAGRKRESAAARDRRPQK